MKKIGHQIIIGIVSTVIGTIIAGLVLWYIERHHLPIVEPPPTAVAQQTTELAQACTACTLNTDHML